MNATRYATSCSQLTRAIALTCLSFFLCASAFAEDALLWDWHYEGNGVSAFGTLMTSAQPVQGAYYRILNITGTRNAKRIKQLTPNDEAIPLNTGYPVDNLIGLDGSLTGSGFGFETADRQYVNAYAKQTSKGMTVFEVFTEPANSVFNEQPIRFSAHPQNRPRTTPPKRL